MLWRKVAKGLSAGRVQSVATRIVVERERERMRFRSASWWSVEGSFSAESQPFAARLVEIGGRQVATGDDFGPAGTLVAPGRGRPPRRAGGARARRGSRRRRVPASPASRSAPTADRRPPRSSPPRSSRRRPESCVSPPSGRCRSRSDSTSGATSPTCGPTRRRCRTPPSQPPVSRPGRSTATSRSRARPRTYRSRVKNAQEAHEAIRPAGDRFRAPSAVAGELSGEERRLYELVWQRTVASQMNDATGTTARARIEAPTLAESPVGPAGTTAAFVATGTVITDPGFLAVYREDEDDTEDGRSDRRNDQDARLPAARPSARRSTARASRSRTTPPSPRRATPRLRSSGASRSSASAARPPTPASSGPSRTAATSGRRGRRSSRPSRPSPSSACSRTTSPTSSTTASPPRWRTTSTRSPRAPRSRSPGSSASTSASNRPGALQPAETLRPLARRRRGARPEGGRVACTSARSTPGR